VLSTGCQWQALLKDLPQLNPYRVHGKRKWGRMVPKLRWIAVLPGALAGAWLGWFFCSVANRLTLAFVGISPDSFGGRVWVEAISSLVLGAAFVYAGSYIAPSYERRVAVNLARFGIIATAVLVVAALVDLDFWAVWSEIWIALGIGVVTFTTHAHRWLPLPRSGTRLETPPSF
jgi:hypothetical protein